MRAFISILAVAGLFAVALPGYAENAKDNIDGGLTYDPTTGGRSPFIDEGTVKSGGTMAKPGQTADEPKVTQTNKKKSKKAKTPAPVPTN
jgi:hypothetical protein